MVCNLSHDNDFAIELKLIAIVNFELFQFFFVKVIVLNFETIHISFYLDVRQIVYSSEDQQVHRTKQVHEITNLYA